MVPMSLTALQFTEGPKMSALCTTMDRQGFLTTIKQKKKQFYAKETSE